MRREAIDRLIGDMGLFSTQPVAASRLAKLENQIKALEEAICPRVAARLQSLEKAIDNQHELNAIQSELNETVFYRLNVQGTSIDTEQPAKPAKPVGPHSIVSNGVVYSRREADIARKIDESTNISFHCFTDYLPLAREIVELIASV